ncbi:hybrid sensor histidine kinase/response regulator [Donghicola mangrovi]|uniref:Sensory/regulatory protein RpfC n=1 Tax=Donghicola mangrovi TaxID=2729614 RepID=A0A850Q720_9RHOB|nr:response regulator [Donghicola mangrovi]NVO22520.1 response regulator [Donghicola mangrovi]
MTASGASRTTPPVLPAGAGKFRGYARGRADLLSLRVVVGAFGALVLFAPYSWPYAAVAAIAVCIGEALDSISLGQSVKRIERGGALEPEIRFSIITAFFQSIVFSAVVIAAAVIRPYETVDMFLITYLFAAAMNAGMIMFFNTKATYARLSIYGIALCCILAMRWLYFWGSPILVYETAGVLLLVYVGYRIIDFADVSFRKQENDRSTAQEANQSLTEANQRLVRNELHLSQLAAVAENANDSVIVFDTMGRITWVNEAFEKLTGYTLNEAYGRRAGSLLNGPLTSSETVARIEHAAATGSSLRVQIQNYTKGGDPFWVETNLVPLPASPTSPGGMVAIERDITTAKIAEAELAQAKRKAERSEAAKTQFLATTSHEIRTPMNAIVGLTDLLAEKHLDPESTEYVAALQDSAQSLLRIVNDILDLSKLEAGKLKIIPTVFSVSDFFAKLDGLMRPRAQAKGLSLTLDLPDDMPLIFADEGRIRQILVNLIDNAIKFTREGGVTVSLQTNRIANTCRFAVDVTDSGIGISEDGMRRLFGYYAQAEDTTSVEFGGTGLGLAISRQLAREMGGDLTVVSHEGQGSCFSLFLPVPCAVKRPDAQQPAPAPAAAPVPTLTGHTIMVAEDNATNRMLMKKFLDSCGATLLFAEDGQEAVETFAASRPGLILMDMQMPNIDGLEATRQIRALGGQQPYIIALTANAQKDDRDRCIDAGMDDFLTKPVRKAELLELLNKVLLEPHETEKQL